MSLIDLLFGAPLASDEDQQQKVGPATGVPIFGLDALGSAAYGPEAALTILIPLGIAGLRYAIPITALIIALLTIVYFSYRQTIEAYPNGGGSYTVASQNLGNAAGLFAASALMIDYVLVVAVGISAGIGALVSAIPSWQPHTLAFCLIVLALLTIVNLRGTRETGVLFMLPTWMFVGCLGAMVAIGVWKSLHAPNWHPIPVLPTPKPGPPMEAAGLWILLRAFSSGCTAMTGVEAISNGVTAFREPRSKTAQLTLTIIIGILILLLAGIAWLCRAYDVGATSPGGPGYESVLSQLLHAIAGRGWFYAISIAAILTTLTLQANTAFADFPRLCRAIAQDGYLPRSFANRGRRLVYTHGIVVLVILAGALLIMFEGLTDRLIPLFAIGAFLAFSLSQAGMVAHWKREGGKHARHSMVINSFGALATTATAVVVAASKFVEGAWVTLVLIPAMLITMRSVKRHYDRVERELAAPAPVSLEGLQPPLVVLPLEHWSKIGQRALRFALAMSPDVVALHVASEDSDGCLSADDWRKFVEEPSRKARLAVPQLVTLKSPYRYVITPILNYVFELERANPNRQIAVLVPNLVERRWYHRFLHNQRGELLTVLLLLKSDGRIAVVNVPWRLRA